MKKTLKEHIRFYTMETASFIGGIIFTVAIIMLFFAAYEYFGWTFLAR